MSSKAKLNSGWFTLSPSVNKRANVAVLIDGDNAQAALFEKILLEVARYGRPTIRRIYGDWTAVNMAPWKNLIHDQAACRPKRFYGAGRAWGCTGTSIISPCCKMLLKSVFCF